MKSVEIFNDKQIFFNILHYLYNNYCDDFDRLEYLSEATINPLEFRFDKSQYNEKVRVIIPNEIDMNILHDNESIQIKVEYVKDMKGNNIKLIQSKGCSAMEEIIY